VKVLRDGRWNEQDAAVLVPGDIISIKLGDIVAADARLLEGDPLKIDQVDSLVFVFQHFSFYVNIFLIISAVLIHKMLNGSITSCYSFFAVCTHR
jgi:hypothetical protein